MLKKLLVLTLAIMMAFSFVACGEEAPEQPKETPTPTPTTTPEPIIMMNDGLLGESTLTYKKFIKAIKSVYEKEIKNEDLSEPFDTDNGITASIFYVLKEDALFECNVLGYKYEDKSNTSYLKAIYKEYEGHPYDIELEGVYLTYKFTCESKEYAFKLMDRDVKALSAFAEVENAETSKEVTQATCDAMVLGGEALTVTAGKNTTAEITLKNSDNGIVYQINVVIR